MSDYGERERIVRWRAAHPEKVREYATRMKRRRDGQVRKKGEKFSRGEIWERDKGICGICGSPADPEDWDIDHIVSLAQGGGHTKSNVQVAHPACNQRKGGYSRIDSGEELA